MFQKTVYRHIVRQRKSDGWENLLKVGNDFQNLDKATKRFDGLGIDPYGSLSMIERGRLNVFVQMRHIIGHNLGIIDDKYLRHDPLASDGRTLHLKATEVIEFAGLCQKVVVELEQHI